MEKSRIDQVVNDVLEVVGNLLANGTGVADLKACVEFAQEAWGATKTRKNLYHLSFQPLQRGDPEWTTINLSIVGGGKAQQPAIVHGVNDDVVVVVFPHIYVAENPMKQLDAGIALRRYQTMAAKTELEEEDFRPPFIGSGTTRPKPPPGRTRKKSVALVEHDGAQRQSSGKGLGR
jgi:hypothetical protein